MSSPELRVVISGELAGFLQALQKAVKETQSFAAAARDSGGQAREAGRAAEDSFRRAGGAAQGMTGSIVTAGVAVVGLREIVNGLRTVITKVVETGLQFERTFRALQFATGDGGSAFAFARETAKELGLELTSTAQSFGKFAASTRGTRLEGQATRDIFKSVAGAATVLGLSVDDTNGVFLALSQIASKGTLSAEELRQQLGERLPGAFQIAARSLGVTTQELGKMLSEGKILSEDFLPRFGAQIRKEFGDAPQQAAKGLQAQINLLGNAWNELLLAVANAGPLKEVAASLGEITQNLESAAANGVPQEIAGWIARVVGAGRGLAEVLWSIRRAVLGGVAAWATYQGVRVVETTGAWIASKVALIRAIFQERDEKLKAAIAESGYTIEVGKNTLAQIRAAQAINLKTSFAIKEAAATGAMSTEDATAALQSIRLADAKLAEAAAIAQTTRASTGLTAASRVLGGALGWIGLILSVGAGLWAYFSSKTDEAKQKAEEANRALRNTAEGIQKTREVTKEYGELVKALEQGRIKGDEATKAKDRLKALQNQLILQYPELKKVFEDEKKSWIEIKQAIDAAAGSRERDLRLKSAELGRDIQRAETEVGEARGRAATSHSLQNAQLGARFGGRYAEAAIRPVSAETIENDPDVQKAKEKVKSLRQAQADIDELLKSLDKPQGAAGAEGKTGGGGKDNTFQAELRRLAEERLKFAEKLTLKEQEQNELRKLALDIEEHRARIEKEAREKKISNNEKEAALAGVALLQLQGEASIRAKFAREREQLEADLQAKLTAQEEGGLAKRLEEVHKHFQAIRKEAARLAENGEPTIPEARIQAAEDADAARARQEQVKQDLQDLKKSLSELAEIRGPLTLDEIGTALEAFAQKSETAKDAVEQFKKEIHLNDGAGAGIGVGLRQFLAESQNGFEQFRQLALDVANSIRNAYATVLDELILKGQSLTGALTAAWRAFSQAAVQSITKVIAAKGAEWTLDRAKFLWDRIKAEWNKANAVKEAALSSVKAGAAAKETAANTTAATSGFFKAHSWIPFAGAAIALGFIALMLNSIKGRAVGGLVTKPEITLLGEAGPEVVAPEHDFKHWAAGLVGLGANLASNITNSQAVERNYRIQGANLAARAADHEPVPASAPVFDLRGAMFMGSEEETRRMFADFAHAALVDRERRLG